MLPNVLMLAQQSLHTGYRVRRSQHPWSKGDTYSMSKLIMGKYAHIGARTVLHTLHCARDGKFHTNTRNRSTFQITYCI